MLKEGHLKLHLIVGQIWSAFPVESAIFSYRLLVPFFSQVNIELDQALDNIFVYLFFISFLLDQDLQCLFYNDV